MLPLRVIKTRRPQDETNASFSKSIVRQCLEIETQLFPEQQRRQRQAASSSQSVVDFRIRSVMCGPLILASTAPRSASSSLDTQDRSKKFGNDDLNRLPGGVANQASIALGQRRSCIATPRARPERTRDLHLAKAMQTSFLPDDLPKVSGYDFYAHYSPCREVGGDYYGFQACRSVPAGSPSVWATLPAKWWQRPCSWPNCRPTCGTAC